jgi:hypothetical protein
MPDDFQLVFVRQARPAISPMGKTALHLAQDPEALPEVEVSRQKIALRQELQSSSYRMVW